MFLSLYFPDTLYSPDKPSGSARATLDANSKVADRRNVRKYVIGCVSCAMICFGVYSLTFKLTGGVAVRVKHNIRPKLMAII